MKALRPYILLFCACLAASCAKKKYPNDVVENSAVYKFSALINNQPVTLAAGVNNYYMYSSYAQDSSGLYDFTGHLKQIDCSNCTNSIKIQINDYKTLPVNAPMVLDSVLYPHSTTFLGNKDGYLARFQSAFNKTAASYSWDFGDGTHSNEANPEHVYAATGYYTVVLKITSSNGCESTSRQIQKVAVGAESYLSYITASDSAGSSYTHFSTTTLGGRPPYHYKWNFGDGSPADNSATPVHNYTLTGGFPVSVWVTDADGKTVVAGYNIVTERDHSSCGANFKMSPIVPLNYTLPLSKVIVSWTDANGVVYTSDNGSQAADSRFEITSVEDGGNNENNMPMKKLHVVFNCTVYNGATALSIRNAEAVISVAYR